MKIDGETMETVTDLILGGSEITADGDHSHEMKRRLILGWKAMTHLESILKIKDITFPTEVHLVKAMIFPVVMHGYDSWTIRKAEHRRTDAFELWPPLDCKEIQGVNPKGNQSWILIGKPDAEAEALILWPPYMKNWVTGKDSDAEKDWRQEKGTTEDEMVEWYNRLE